jgi:1-acyl-sn-glycerol-3-phosphate acyltransferase
MRNLAAFIKTILVPLLTLLHWAWYAAGLVFIRASGRPFEPWRNRCMGRWGRWVMAILGIRAEIRGTPPEPPFFLVSNHISYLDIVVLSSVLKTTFISKAEVSRWPVMGMISKSLGILFINRRRHRDIPRLNRKLARQVHEHQGVVLFPEGTTSSGEEVLEFRPPLLEFPASQEFEVSAVCLTYRTGENDPPAADSIGWDGGENLLSHFFNMARNRRIFVTLTFGKRTMHHHDRKELARLLHREVSRLHASSGEEAALPKNEAADSF